MPEPALTASGPVTSRPVTSRPVTSGPVTSGPVTSGPVTSGPGAAGAHEEVYGLLVVAGTQVALPLSALREVVPCPPRLAALPVSAAGLLGAMELREMVVPVVDLGERLGLPASRGSDALGAAPARREEDVVVVVASGDHLLGVLAQEVRGVVHVAGSHLMELRAEGGPLLVSSAFRQEDGGIVSVLDPDRVVALPGVPTVRDRPRGVAVGARSASAGATGGDGGGDEAGGETRTTWTLLRCGEHLLALDVAHVHTTLPHQAPRASVLDGGLCLGVTSYRDLDVPVVDPLQLLGLGRTDPPVPGSAADAGAGLVLRLDDGFVVLTLSELVGLVEVAPSDGVVLPAFSVPRPDLLAGMADLPGHGPCLVLDGRALLGDTSLRELASANVSSRAARDAPATAPVGAPAPAPTTTRDDGAAASAARAPSYLTYRAGAPLATRLEQVAEILPIPTPGGLVAPVGEVAGGRRGVLGVMAHRGASLPVLHLPTLLGLPARPGADDALDGCLLLVATAHGHLAFVVDSLHEIEPLTWVDPAATEPTEGAAAGAGSGDPLRTSRLIQVGGSETLLRELDLVALATSLAS